MSEELKEKLAGIGAFVPLVTPATPDYEVDIPRFREQVRFVMDGGIKGKTGALLAAGGGGEGYFLNDEEWYAVIKAFAEEAAGKVTTMAGVFELSTKNAIRKIKFAEDLGIDLIQLAPPHYEKPTDIEVYTHYKMINDAVSKVGIMLYHTYWAFPEYYEMTTPLFKKIAELDHIVGIKWASARFRNFLDVLFGFQGRFIFEDNQGWMQLLGEAKGMHGTTMWIGNYIPETAARLIKLIQKGDIQQFAKEAREANALRNAVAREIAELAYGTSATGEFGTLGEGSSGKTIMKLVGRPCGPPFPPQIEPTPEQLEEIRARLEKRGLL